MDLLGRVAEALDARALDTGLGDFMRFHKDKDTGRHVWRDAPQPGENTTLVVVATDGTLTKAQTRRLAMMAQDGMARALRPIHTPLDGDLVFAAATGARPLADPMIALAELGSLAADVVARAIARGVYEARALAFPGAQPGWRDKFG